MIDRIVESVLAGRPAALLAADPGLRERALRELHLAFVKAGASPTQPEQLDGDARPSPTTVLILTRYVGSAGKPAVMARGRFVVVAHPRDWLPVFGLPEFRELAEKAKYTPVWLPALDSDASAAVMLRSAAERSGRTVGELVDAYPAVRVLLDRAHGGPTFLTWLDLAFADGASLPATDEQATALYWRIIERHRKVYAADELYHATHDALQRVIDGAELGDVDRLYLQAHGVIDGDGAPRDSTILDWFRALGPESKYGNKRRAALPAPTKGVPAITKTTVTLNATHSVCRASEHPMQRVRRAPRLGAESWDEWRGGITSDGDAFYACGETRVRRFTSAADTVWTYDARTASSANRPLAAPIVAREAVLVPFWTRSGTELHVIDRETGALRHTQQLPESGDDSRVPGFAVLDGWLFVPVPTKVATKSRAKVTRVEVACVELLSGSRRTKFDLDALNTPVDGRAQGDVGDVASEDQTLFVAHGYAVAAFSVDSARVSPLWRRPLVFGGPNVERARLAVGGTVLVTWGLNGWAVFDKATGEPLWAKQQPLRMTDTSVREISDGVDLRQVIAAGELVVVVTPPEDDQYKVSVYEARTGALLTFMRRPRRPSIASDGKVVWICAGGIVSELDPRAQAVLRRLEDEADYAYFIRTTPDRITLVTDKGVELWERPA